MARLGLNVLFVFVVLMWCTSVSCPVVLDWSVNELQASEGQTNCCRVTLMVVWHCVLHLVASFVAAVDMYGWSNSGQTSGPVEAEQNVHDMCLTWVSALSDIFVVPCGDIIELCWFVESGTFRVLYPQWCLAIICGSCG